MADNTIQQILESDNEAVLDNTIGLTQVSTREAAAVDPNYNPVQSRSNQQYNYQKGLAVFNAKVAQYGGDQAKGLAAYLEGDDAIKEAEKKAAEDGSVGVSWVNFMKRSTQDRIAKAEAYSEKVNQHKYIDKYGRRINGFNVSGVATAEKQLLSEDEFRERLIAKNPMLANKPQLLERSVAQLVANQNKRFKNYKAQRGQLLSDIGNQLLTNGGDAGAIPEEQWESLTPKEQHDVLAAANKIRKQEDVTDYAETAGIDENWLANATVDEVNAMRVHFSSKDFAILMGQFQAIQRKKLIGSAQQSVIQQQLQQTAAQGNLYADYVPQENKVERAISLVAPEFDNFLRDKTGNAKVLSGIFTKALAGIYQSAGDTNTLKSAQSMAFTIKQNFFLANYYFNSKDSPLLKDVKDLPNDGFTDVRRVIENITKATYGTDNPSDALMQKVYYDILLDDNAEINTTGVAYDEDLMKASIEGRNLTGVQKWRAYILNRIGGNFTLKETRTRNEIFQANTGGNTNVNYGY